MADRTVVTKRDLVRGLREVGIRVGDAIGVHSSLSSFGHVEGGAEAVGDALLEAVGPTGSVVVPAYSKNVEHVKRTPEEKALGMTWKSRILPFDPKSHGCWTGKIPDAFWRRPEAVRGAHPTHSLAAIGPKAEQLVKGWHALRDLDGQIVLLGITLTCCSSMHLGEEGIELPRYITSKMAMPAELREKYPEDQWETGYGPYPDFILMEGPCQEKGIMTLVRVGDAVVRRVRLRELIALYAEYLRESPEIFYHGCVELK
jgi:aminoglycoside 3-N-acetyltransferase